MKSGIVRGGVLEVRFKVLEGMKPGLEGRVEHRLYSTWALVYHMECVARDLLAPYLEENEEAVGASVEARHVAAAPIGAVVRVRARVSCVRGARVYARLEAFWKNRRIARGAVVQVVMPRGKFKRLARRRSSKAGA